MIRNKLEKGVDLLQPISEPAFSTTLPAQLKFNPEDSKLMFKVLNQRKEGVGKPDDNNSHASGSHRVNK